MEFVLYSRQFLLTQDFVNRLQVLLLAYAPAWCTRLGLEVNVGQAVPDAPRRSRLHAERSQAQPDLLHFGGVVGATRQESLFLRNAAATFSDSSTYTRATRFSDSIVIQRSDIPFSVENVRRMKDGNTPFVRNANGEWEMLNLHHVGREDKKLIEVISSQNVYNNTTGGPLHIPGPGGPVRNRTFGKGYWQKRLKDAIEAGQIPQSVLDDAGVAP